LKKRNKDQNESFLELIDQSLASTSQNKDDEDFLQANRPDTFLAQHEFDHGFAPVYVSWYSLVGWEPHCTHEEDQTSPLVSTIHFITRWADEFFTFVFVLIPFSTTIRSFLVWPVPPLTWYSKAARCK
jgi:hypothetical protein